MMSVLMSSRLDLFSLRTHSLIFVVPLPHLVLVSPSATVTSFLSSYGAFPRRTIKPEALLLHPTLTVAPLEGVGVARLRLHASSVELGIAGQERFVLESSICAASGPPAKKDSPSNLQ